MFFHACWRRRESQRDIQTLLHYTLHTQQTWLSRILRPRLLFSFQQTFISSSRLIQRERILMKNLFSSNFSYNRTPAIETVKISKCYKKINQSLTIYKSERRKFSLPLKWIASNTIQRRLLINSLLKVSNLRKDIEY